MNGAVGGSYSCPASRCGEQSAGTSSGGFGCGGTPLNSGGGGGGYRGGNSLLGGASGHGGLSYNQGLNTTCVAGDNNGNGIVLIELVKRHARFNTCLKRNNMFAINVISMILVMNSAK